MKNSFVVVLILQLVLGTVPNPAGAHVLKQHSEGVTETNWINTQPLTLADLRGKIVVLEYWAPWCQPCRSSIPRLNALHKRYKDKGVIVIGITAESKAKAEPYVKTMGIEYVVATNCNSAVRIQRTRGIPHVLVLGTKGVIRWQGHPMAGLQRAVEKQLKKTPPTSLLPKRRKSAQKLIVEAEDALLVDSYRRAFFNALQVKGMENANRKLLTRADAVIEEITGKTEKELADARKLVDAGDYSSADRALKRIRNVYAGLPAAAKASRLLKDMHKNPEMPQLIRAANGEKRAQRILDSAELARKKGRYAEALEQYDRLLKRYPNTQSGKIAARKAAAIRLDYNAMTEARKQLAKRYN